MTLDDARPIGDAETRSEDCGCGCGSAAKATTAGENKECLDACQKAYDDCIGKAGSDAEKLACTAAYNRCITNC